MFSISANRDNMTCEQCTGTRSPGPGGSGEEERWTLVRTRHEAIISDQDRRIDHIIISAHTPGGTAACVWQIKTKIHLIECHVVMPGPSGLSGRALLC